MLLSIHVYRSLALEPDATAAEQASALITRPFSIVIIHVIICQDGAVHGLEADALVLRRCRYAGPTRVLSAYISGWQSPPRRTEQKQVDRDETRSLGQSVGSQTWLRHATDVHR